jgi:hypothetical protein
MLLSFSATIKIKRDPVSTAGSVPSYMAFLYASHPNLDLKRSLGGKSENCQGVVQKLVAEASVKSGQVKEIEDMMEGFENIQRGI